MDDTLTKQTKTIQSEMRGLKAQFLELNTASIADWPLPSVNFQSPASGSATGHKWHITFRPSDQSAVPLVNFWLDCNDIENRGIHLEQHLQIQPGVLELKLPYLSGQSNWNVTVSASSLARGTLTATDMGEYYG